MRVIDPALTEQLQHLLGAPLFFERLSGAGGSGAYLVDTTTGGQAVLKVAVPTPEYAFYRLIAPHFPVRVPSLLASGHHPCDWILLKREPASLPRERWIDDPEVIAYLAKVHRALKPLEGIAFTAADGFQFSPVPAFSPHVISRLPGELSLVVRQLLLIQVPQVEELCSAKDWIQGDPNPTNWLLDAQGRLVLTDWSRWGQAHPAIDLAIMMAGLPDHTRAQAVARQYLRHRPELDVDTESLASFILLAKLWVSLDFLRMGMQGDLSSDGDDALIWLSESLGPWAQSTFRHRRVASCPLRDR